MPVIDSKYKAKGIFKNAHFSTIYASTFRKVNFSAEKRERLELKDGDFLDLDRTYSKGSENLLILLHGLAGNAQRPYMLGMAKAFSDKGWDTAAMNFRSCSGEINRLYRSYNAGATEDLEAVIDHLNKEEKYSSIVLAGFSLGGNLLLKYLGETANIPLQIKSAVAVSVPCDLGASLEELNRNKNFLYSKRFIRNLKRELFLRQEQFPLELGKREITSCNSLLAIDELYTSKAHGYKNASDYYQKCSCLQFLPNINIPTLLLNAANDTFLPQQCYPVKIAENSKFLHLEIPAHGGHVGFINSRGSSFHEERAMDFVKDHL